MQEIKQTILVLSGKGGVGKSTIATQLALSLVGLGSRVGLLDVDLCGPSIPKLVGLQGKDVKKCSEGWVPVYSDESKRFSVMSIGFLLPDENASVAWRGPKKTSMIRNFFEDVCWGSLDFLVIDTPPGTSDEHISVVEILMERHSNAGAVIVTTPQSVSISDVRKEISFCRKIKLPILGLIENMSGFVCPHCSECTNVFSSDGGRLLADEFQIRFVGKIPLDPVLTSCCERGINFLEQTSSSLTIEPIRTFAKKLLEEQNAVVPKCQI